MRAMQVLVVLGALFACKNRGNEQSSPALGPGPAAPAPEPPVVVEGPKAETSCARLGAYYTLGGGVQKGGVNISCDGKCNDIKEQDDGAKLELSCNLSCTAIGTAKSKFAGSLNVRLNLARSEKDPNRYSGTISDGKAAPNVVSLSFKQKYDEANGQMTERDMRWSMTLRPCN
jgi:hypothetical protein